MNKLKVIFGKSEVVLKNSRPTSISKHVAENFLHSEETDPQYAQ